MTHDEVIEMARQAWADAGEVWVVKDWFDDRATAFELLIKLVAAKEREACAKIVEDSQSYDWHKFACEAAYAIRARGEQA
jgi:hypothetical protein